MITSPIKNGSFLGAGQLSPAPWRGWKPNLAPSSALPSQSPDLLITELRGGESLSAFGRSESTSEYTRWLYRIRRLLLVLLHKPASTQAEKYSDFSSTSFNKLSFSKMTDYGIFCQEQRGNFLSALRVAGAADILLDLGGLRKTAASCHQKMSGLF